MARIRRKYSAEFKREAVRLSQDPERTVAEVCAALGIDPSVLKRWRSALKAHGQESFPGQGRRKSSDKEVERLRSELARAQEERDILKKALEFFARERS
jgi:transposase